MIEIGNRLENLRIATKTDDLIDNWTICYLYHYQFNQFYHNSINQFPLQMTEHNERGCLW